MNIVTCIDRVDSMKKENNEINIQFAEIISSDDTSKVISRITNLYLQHHDEETRIIDEIDKLNNQIWDSYHKINKLFRYERTIHSTYNKYYQNIDPTRRKIKLLRNKLKLLEDMHVDEIKTYSEIFPGVEIKTDDNMNKIKLQLDNAIKKLTIYTTWPSIKKEEDSLINQQYEIRQYVKKLKIEKTEKNNKFDKVSKKLDILFNLCKKVLCEEYAMVNNLKFNTNKKNISKSYLDSLSFRCSTHCIFTKFTTLEKLFSKKCPIFKN